jgi:hypothetical protein
MLREHPGSMSQASASAALSSAITLGLAVMNPSFRLSRAALRLSYLVFDRLNLRHLSTHGHLSRCCWTMATSSIHRLPSLSSVGTCQPAFQSPQKTSFDVQVSGTVRALARIQKRTLPVVLRQSGSGGSGRRAEATEVVVVRAHVHI